MKVFEKPQSGGSSMMKIFQKLELEVLQFQKNGSKDSFIL
jgi:hypothetical protein